MFSIDKFIQQDKDKSRASLVKEFELREFRPITGDDMNIVISDMLIVSLLSSVVIGVPVLIFLYWVRPVSPCLLVPVWLMMVALVALRRYQFMAGYVMQAESWQSGHISWEHSHDDLRDKQVVEIRLQHWEEGDHPYLAEGRSQFLDFSQEMFSLSISVAPVALADGFSKRSLSTITGDKYSELKELYLMHGLIRQKGRTEHAGFELSGKGKAFLSGLLSHSPTELPS